MFSEALTGTWNFIEHAAYNTTAQSTDGTTSELTRQERPKLFFSTEGEMTPLYLINGVVDSGGGGRSFTLVQPIGDGC